MAPAVKVPQYLPRLLEATAAAVSAESSALAPPMAHRVFVLGAKSSALRLTLLALHHFFMANTFSCKRAVTRRACARFASSTASTVAADVADAVTDAAALTAWVASSASAGAIWSRSCWKSAGPSEPM